ncbi:tRNA-Thr(GGU) m(6)t(6)A37 methyltransferase TsaA [Anaerotaenia torta]|uniref:tRNA (N6-threonylcarbamoyladenosine(37)-N6)-methyltransferase TrmO n=1 Tax=Anaerotaenia torta TaxID=433293 RepID=UPI003D1A4FDA
MMERREDEKDQQELQELRIIARIHTDFSTKFGIPRQSGIVKELKAVIVFEPEYRKPEALQGLEGFSYIWLIWGFSKNMQDTWSPLVRPPRLGGTKRMGVFATRSPFRPNPIGLSSVQLDKIERGTECGPLLHISGADLADGTPIYDIKPYLPYTDSHPEASGGFADPVRDYGLKVVFPEEWRGCIPEDRQEALMGVLAHDPRPAYQNDPNRIYGFEFCGKDVRFTVEDGVLTVYEIVEIQGGGDKNGRRKPEYRNYGQDDKGVHLQGDSQVEN